VRFLSSQPVFGAQVGGSLCPKPRTADLPDGGRFCSLAI